MDASGLCLLGETPAGGNCFWHAVSSQLERLLLLRRDVVEHIRTSPVIQVYAKKTNDLNVIFFPHDQWYNHTTKSLNSWLHFHGIDIQIDHSNQMCYLFGWWTTFMLPLFRILTSWKFECIAGTFKFKSLSISHHHVCYFFLYHINKLPPPKCYMFHKKSRFYSSILSQIAKFTGPTWGPPGSCRP